jgi:hypothetical protein
VTRIRRDFPAGSAEEAARRLTDLPADVFGLQDHERVMAAIVWLLLASGSASYISSGW